MGNGASDGTRTRDIQDHNLALYQLSYTRHTARRLPPCPGEVNHLLAHDFAYAGIPVTSVPFHAKDPAAMRLPAALFALLLLAACFPARADEVSEQINEALAAYQKKDTATALAALDAAANLLRQARAETFKQLLPAALPGWIAAEPEVNVLQGVVLGGGSTASRRYSKGDDQVTVEIAVDGPVVQGMAAMLSGPILAATGARQVVINGKRMAYMKDDNAYLALIGGRLLVKVSGNPGMPDEALRAYAGALDFAAIEKSVRE